MGTVRKTITLTDRQDERRLIGGLAWVGKSCVGGSVLIAPEATLFRLDVDRFLKFSGKL